MIAYFDTSAVIPLIVEEPASQTCVRLWNESTRILSVRLLYPEGCAALARARWMHRLTPAAAVSAADDELVLVSGDADLLAAAASAGLQVASTIR